MEPQLAGAAEQTTDQSVFEGLFTRTLKPEGPFADDLRAIGYDPKKPLPRYSTQVWQQAVKVACRHVYPNLPETEALRQLGRRFAEGFNSTIIGKVIDAMSPFLSPETSVKRIPKFAAMGMSGLEITQVASGPGWWLLRWKDRYAVPEFVLGIFESGIKPRSAFSAVELVSKSADGYDLKFTARAK